MNCTTCRFQLSQCLDGRLPSGRRTEVMKHAESCSTCAKFWTDLQEAQRLTLSLRSQEVGSSFRDGLWERIHAGEGTPTALLQEIVPVSTKIRYAMTGAAAAAFLLLGITFLQSPSTIEPSNAVNVADRSSSDQLSTNRTARSNPAPAGGANASGDTATLASNSAGTQYDGATHLGGLEPRTRMRQQLANTPLMSSATPLTVQVLAVETALQLEERYATAAIGMRNMHNPNLNREAAMHSVIESANELRAFGELLLELRDRRRLFFTDARLDADLQFAVRMLAQAPALDDRSPQTIETIIAPALRSHLLGTISSAISLAPVDKNAELRDLMELNTQRPEVFPMLFFVLGDLDEIQRGLSLATPGRAFFLQDTCAPSWVAPRSKVAQHTMRLMRAEQVRGQVRGEGKQTKMGVPIELDTSGR